MSRSVLSLFTLDRDALLAFDRELHDILSNDDRDALVSLVGLGGGFADMARSSKRAVDLFLVPETEASHAGLYASVRRVAKKRALSHVWTSESPSLEGRLREYDVIREDGDLARRADTLLDSRTLPWFLRRPGGTGGTLRSQDREELSQALEALRRDLPDEVAAFGAALAEMDGDVMCHDALL